MYQEIGRKKVIIMKKLKSILAGLLSMSLLFSATACGEEAAENSSHYKAGQTAPTVREEGDLGGSQAWSPPSHPQPDSRLGALIQGEP